MPLLGFDHVQLAFPRGKQLQVRAFYGDLLGLQEIKASAELERPGVVRYRVGALRLDLAEDSNGVIASKLHAAFLARGLPEIAGNLRAVGLPIDDSQPLPGYQRIFAWDPFGNRLELLEPETAAVA